MISEKTANGYNRQRHARDAHLTKAHNRKIMDKACGKILRLNDRAMAEKHEKTCDWEWDYSVEPERWVEVAT